jgi:hypothetical protein
MLYDTQANVWQSGLLAFWTDMQSTAAALNDCFCSTVFANKERFLLMIAL